MKEIIVKNQQEWNEIPKDFNGIIYIQSERGIRIKLTEHKGFRVVARENSSVEAWENSSVVAWGNSSVEARENSSVEARENSSVEAWENSSVVAWGNSSVEARENSSVEAWENSSVVAWGNSSVEAWENSSVEARENSSVVAWGNSSVEARENSSVVAWENSSVVAWGNSSVEARENSSVEAWGNSSVEAWGNSSVEARENSSVNGQGNAQIIKRSDVATLLAKGNARIVTMPSTPEEYCDFYGIDIRDNKAILYKSVTTRLCSFHDRNFQYVIGESKQENCDPNIKRDCSYGLHVSHLNWALQFGRQYSGFRIIECAVPLDKIVVPLDSCGKVRASELTVLREVPKEEWGVYGRVMCK